MTARQWLLCLIPLAYLVGATPFGLLVGLAKGIDVRKAGSGNIGATNVGRLLGKRFFFIVFFLDVLKGHVMMLIAGLFAAKMGGNMLACTLWLTVGLAAIVGHTASPFLKFKGGKGVSTTVGVVLGVWPYFTITGVIALSIFGIVLMLTRYMSVGSMAGAVAIPVVYLALAMPLGWDPFGKQLPLLLFAIVVAALIVYRHRGNIARLRAGTEPRLGSHRNSNDEIRNPNERSKDE
jgi:glycerol-3-phosphate acyltransferase PlsY